MTAKSLRIAHQRRYRAPNRVAEAAACLGALGPGTSITGITGGEFSAIDALEHIVEELGQATARVTTWSAGVHDAQRAARLQACRKLSDVRILLDRKILEHSPQYAATLTEALGVDAFRCLSVNAKIVVIEGERGSAAFRSSMNLNKNLRSEHFDLTIDAPGEDGVAAFYAAWFDALWDAAGESRTNTEILRRAYDRFLEPAQGPVLSEARVAAGRSMLDEISLDGLGAAGWRDRRR